MEQNIIGKCVFRRVRKATISFGISVFPSVRPHAATRLPRARFSRNLISECYSKICPEYLMLIKVWRDSRVLYMKICVHLYFVLSILLGIRNVLDKSCRENQNTHFIVQFFSPENRASMRCGKIRYSQRQQMTIRCMRTVCLITKAARARTHTHTQRIRYTYCFSTATMVTHTCLNFTFIRTIPVITQDYTKSISWNLLIQVYKLLLLLTTASTRKLGVLCEMFWPHEICCCCCRRRACAVLALPVKQLPPHSQCQKAPII